ncbi:unnamed protein product [Chironomus riparius]|uniref:Uncharacterized protein n=1 Tax=Chironomus riparius TaxID=315576 RepID=A0A9N9WWP8_9DIPT|nr:unnamed protein product [Chironomus riparius]CAG9812130.1 unnamed protein product [Chironomus riparius]
MRSLASTFRNLGNFNCPFRRPSKITSNSSLFVRMYFLVNSIENLRSSPYAVFNALFWIVCSLLISPALIRHTKKPLQNI